MAQLTFDATRVEPDNGIEVVPAGWYNVAIDESANKPTKDGLNAYTQFRMSILDGQYKGRKLFARFNLQHSNAQTSEIAQRQLSALCHATGVLQLSDTQQLHNIPFKAKAIIKQDAGYEASNEVRSFKNINEAVDGVASAPAAQAASAPPPAAQPWAQVQAASAPPAMPPAMPPAAPPVAVAPAAPAFPPAGWTAHPSAPGFYYAGQEVLSEADLRARFAPPTAPAAPPMAPAAPEAGAWQPPAGQQPWGQPAAAAPPAGAPAAPVAAAGAPVAAAGAPAAPHPAQGFAPPWTTPAQ